MAWQIEWELRASHELLKLDKQTQREIVKYLDERIASGNDPRVFGTALTRNLAGLWRYRIGDYRVLCKILDEQLIVIVVHVAHRREVYDRHGS